MKKCEFCHNIHDGTFASGRFCSRKCARAFSTAATRKTINERVSEKLRTFYPSKTQVLTALLEAKSLTDVGRKLGCTSNLAKVARKVLQEYDIEFTCLVKTPKSPQDVLCKRPGESKGPLRRMLVEMGRKYECEVCHMGPEWNGKTLTLQVDHKDGDKWNHIPENLRFLCPNCHSQTDTFAWKNAHKKRREAQVQN